LGNQKWSPLAIGKNWGFYPYDYNGPDLVRDLTWENGLRSLLPKKVKLTTGTFPDNRSIEDKIFEKHL